MTLIDSEVAACAAGVSARTIRRWIAAGLLTNHGDVRRIQVDLDTLGELVDAQAA